MTYRVDSNAFVAESVCYNHRASGDAVRRKNRYLRLVDDCGCRVGAKSSIIGDGEGASADVIQIETPVSRTQCQIVNCKR